MRRLFDIRVSPVRGRYAVLARYDAKKFECDEAFSHRFVLDKKPPVQLGKFLLDLSCESSSALNVRFCDVDEMRDLNREFRGKDRPTDVLSFPNAWQMDFFSGCAQGTKKDRFLGDIAICLPVCVWQAKERRHSLSRELERMLVHGISHLLGFDHERSESAWRLQNALEKAFLAEMRSFMGRVEWIQIVGTDRKIRAK